MTERQQRVGISPCRSGGTEIENFLLQAGSTFCADSYFGIRSTPVLPQQHVKYPGHSAKSAAGGKLQLLKHTYTLRMWLCMKRHGAWLYGVHRTCAQTAAVSLMWHQPCQRCKYTTSVDIQKLKLITHVESHASAVSLLESGEQRY